VSMVRFRPRPPFIQTPISASWWGFGFWGGSLAATGHGCITFLLLRPLQKGRITTEVVSLNDVPVKK
jgi:hypothetical protein